MAEATTKDSESESEDAETQPWVSQTPTTRISGVPKRLIYAGDLGDNVEQNGTSFAVVFEKPEVVNGELWVNEAKPEDGTTEDAVDDGTSRPTDYRVLDSDDESVSFNKDGNVKSGENGPNTYEEADGFEEDEVLVWYNGLAGKRIARTLDFNGRPYADWTDDGSYLLKGLFQPHPEWREDGANRSQLARDDKAPRVARAPILRNAVSIEWGEDEDGNSTLEEAGVDFDDPDEQRILVDISRSGRSYRAHVFDAKEFADEFGNYSADMPRNDEGYVKNDIESELGMLYTSAADEVLEDAGYSMHVYTGSGWQDEPDGWTASSSSEVSFGITADDGGDSSGLPPAQESFVEEMVEALESTHAEKGHAPTPESEFNGGVAGLVGKYEAKFERVPDADDIREVVYERVDHLDTADLE